MNEQLDLAIFGLLILAICDRGFKPMGEEKKVVALSGVCFWLTQVAMG